MIKSAGKPVQTSTNFRKLDARSKKTISNSQRTQQPERFQDQFAHFFSNSKNKTRTDKWIDNEFQRKSLKESAIETSKQEKVGHVDVLTKDEFEGIRLNKLRENPVNDKDVRKRKEQYLTDLENQLDGQTATTSNSISHANLYYFDEEIELLQNEGLDSLSNSIRSENRHIRRSVTSSRQKKSLRPYGIQALFCASCAEHASYGSDSLPKPHLHQDKKVTANDSESDEAQQSPAWNFKNSPENSDNESQLHSGSKGWNLNRRFDSDDSD